MLRYRFAIAALGLLAISGTFGLGDDPPSPSSVLKKGDRHRPICESLEENPCAPEPVPIFQQPAKAVTLLGMLSEWQYPGSKFHGAETSDAAVTDISAIKSQAVLTTPDSAEKVVAFYRDKLKVDATGKNLGAKEGERTTTSRSVSIQENSTGRPLKLYIIAINEAGSSTTLVISRSEVEATTHIAWSNFRKL